MASNRMSAALSVLMARNFSKMFLRARQALEFSHGLDPKRKLSGNACRDATRPNFTGSKRLSDLCWRDDGRSIGPPEFTFFVTLRSTERIARPRNRRLLLWCG